MITRRELLSGDERPHLPLTGDWELRRQGGHRRVLSCGVCGEQVEPNQWAFFRTIPAPAAHSTASYSTEARHERHGFPDGYKPRHLRAVR